MKKIILCGLLLLASFACIKKEAVKPDNKPAIVEEKKYPDISLSKSERTLPKYYQVKNENMYDNLLIVYPENDRGAKIIAGGLRSQMLKTKKIKAKLLKDTEVTKEDLINNNIAVIGNTQNNRLLKELESELSIKADGTKVILGDKTYKGKDTGVTYFYPNLYNLNKTMIFIMGNSERALKMSDYKSYDIVVFDGIKEIIPVYFKERAVASFDENWQVGEIKEVDKKELETGEKDELKVGKLKNYDFPAWAEGKVIYEVYVRSFYDSDNDGRGDLNGLRKKLDYLKDLGVDIIWMMPIFESPSEHGYDVSDYFKINEDYGTNEDFRNLAKEAHKKGMALFLDITLNHSSRKETHFKNAHKNPDSKYDRWFYFGNLGNTIYHSWNFKQNPAKKDSVNANLPAFNTNNKEVLDFHLEILKHWIDPNNDGDKSDGADGFRLDYVKGISHNYWKLLRQGIKEYHKDTILLAEAWVTLEETVPFFDNEMDASIDFGLQGSMTSGVTKDLIDTLKSQEKLFPKNARFARFMSNHDLDRLPQYQRKELLKLYSTLIFTLKGMPMLYYGDELGEKGSKGRDDRGVRRPMPWYSSKTGEGMATWTTNRTNEADGISVEEQLKDKESLLNHTKNLAKLRKKHIEIFNGEFKLLTALEKRKDGSEKNARRCLTYTIGTEKEKALVIFNFSKANSYKLDLSEFKGKKLKEILYKKDKIKIKENIVKIEMDKFEARVYLIK